MAGKTREEIALIEVGHTDIHPRTARILVGFFLVLIVSIPLMQAAYEMFTPDKKLEVLTFGDLLPNDQRVLPKPDEIKSFENHIEEVSLLRAWFLSPTQRWLTRAGVGNEKAYLGRDGWLFYRPGVDYLTGPGFLDEEVIKRRQRSTPIHANPIPALVDFRDQLAARGIELLLVPVPVKPSIYPERLSARYEGYQDVLQNQSYEVWIQRLKEEGLHLYDPAPELKAQSGRDLYLATDTHWTPAGMSLASKGIVAYIKKNQLIQTQKEQIYGREDAFVSNLGDIALMLKLGESQAYPEQQIQITRILQSEESWRSDPSAEVLLLGDSFANIFSLEGMGWGTAAGLAEHLSADLGTPVDKLCINDNGSYATRLDLAQTLHRGEDRLKGKRLVIYEFAARELAVGDWRPIELPQPKSVPVDGEALPEGLVEGQIVATTKVPRPGSVPYKDVVMSVVLKDSADRERVVMLWGMRDNKLTTASEYKPGDAITLNLVSWASVSSEFGGYQRLELSDQSYWDLPMFWATDELTVIDQAIKAEPIQVVNQQQTNPLIAKASVLEAAGQSVLRGTDGWLFFGPELRSLGVGTFWGEPAKKVSRAADENHADPLPAILDFKRQLDQLEIPLIMVPVPAKATLYPDKLGFDPEMEIGQQQQTFFEQLRSQGIQVLELKSLFTALRQRGLDPYLKQDTHWSPAGIHTTATQIAALVREQDWYSDMTIDTYQNKERQIEIEGDLWRNLNDDTPKESVSVNSVYKRKGRRRKAIAPDRSSPLLLMGDSHTLVFHAGDDMLASGAGLPDQLALQLGFPVDLVGVRGSGATPARLELMRRRDNLAGKRMVVWCFTVREFTESPGGWQKVPVVSGVLE